MEKKEFISYKDQLHEIVQTVSGIQKYDLLTADDMEKLNVFFEHALTCDSEFVEKGINEINIWKEEWLKKTESLAKAACIETESGIVNQLISTMMKLRSVVSEIGLIDQTSSIELFETWNCILLGEEGVQRFQKMDRLDELVDEKNTLEDQISLVTAMKDASKALVEINNAYVFTNMECNHFRSRINQVLEKSQNPANKLTKILDKYLLQWQANRQHYQDSLVNKSQFRKKLASELEKIDQTAHDGVDMDEDELQLLISKIGSLNFQPSNQNLDAQQRAEEDLEELKTILRNYQHVDESGYLDAVEQAIHKGNYVFKPKILMLLLFILQKCRDYKLADRRDLLVNNIIQSVFGVSRKKSFAHASLNLYASFLSTIRKSDMKIDERVTNEFLNRCIACIASYPKSISEKSLASVLTYMYDNKKYKQIVEFTAPREQLSNKLLIIIDHWKAEAYRKMGNYKESIQLCQEYIPDDYSNLTKDQVCILCCMAYSYKSAGNRAKALSILSELYLQYGSGHEMSPRIICGLIFLNYFSKSFYSDLDTTLHSYLSNEKYEYMKSDLELALAHLKKVHGK